MTNLPWTRIALGVGALIVAYAWLQVFHRTGRARGHVSAIVTRSGPDGDPTDVPLVSFTVGRRLYSFTPSLVLFGEAKRTRIGKKVLVAYDPDDPRDAELASPYRLYLPPLVVSVLYVALLYFVLGGLHLP